MAKLTTVHALMIGALLACAAGCTTSTRKGTEPPNIADKPGGTVTKPSANSYGDSNRKGWSAVPGGTDRNPDGRPSETQHTNTRMEMNEYLADRITALDEVRRAWVVVTDSNAYVAIEPEPTAGGSGKGTPAGNAAPGGLTEAEGRAPTTANNDVRRVEDESTRRGLTSGIAGNSYDIYSGASGIRGLQDAQTDMNEQLKAKIVERVHSLSSPALQHVYVSANPDFFQRMRTYAEHAKKGLPLPGSVVEFNTMAQRIFPTSNQTGSYGGSWGSAAPGRIIGSQTGDTRITGRPGWRPR